MTPETSTDTPVTAPRSGELITARSVAWALTGAAAFSLAAGVAAVEYLGGFSRQTRPETDPEVVVTAPPDPMQRPTVLPPMTGLREDGPGVLDGFDTLFPPPARRAELPAPLPVEEAAVVPLELRYK